MKKLSVLVAMLLVALMIFAACSTTPAEESSAAESSSAAASESVEASSEAPAESESAAASEEVAEDTAAESQAKSDALIQTLQEDAAASDNSDVVIGYNAGTETLEFFNNVYGGLQYEADQYGAKLLYACSNFDPEQIIPKVNTLMMQGANVIIDFNVNSEIGGNIVDVVKEAGGAGVIGIDVEYFSANGTDRAWFMGANNQVAGELCGQAIANYSKEYKDGQLDMLVLFFNSENGDEVKKRMGGAIDGLAQEGIELTEDQIEWIDMGGGGSDTTVAGKDKFTSWLTAHPDMTSVGVVGVNDETMQGVLAAAETAGRADDVILASHNVSSQFIDQVKQGGNKCWTGSVAYYPERYGEYLVPMAIAMVHADPNVDIQQKITMNHEFVTRDMVEDYEQAYDAYTAQWTE